MVTYESISNPKLKGYCTEKEWSIWNAEGSKARGVFRRTNNPPPVHLRVPQVPNVNPKRGRKKKEIKIPPEAEEQKE